MPLHKGIKINLVSQWELRVHPEFPHPESSRSTFGKPKLERPEGQAGLEDPACAKEALLDEPNRLLGRENSVSVYVPSCSGARFWVRWTVTDTAIEESQWYYFKLSMNGRHITSWGTNAHERASGQVMRGLFEPSERWNYKNAGTVYKNMGTEARPFMFANEGEKELSAAADGGIIEVQVFRALGRKRKLAEPTDFKNQETYGIIGGLLERPQDAKFYDWHLKDPKDSPFAIFSFHYRSWNSLYSLQLIPHCHPRALLSPTPSVLNILGQLHGLQFEPEDPAMDEDKEYHHNWEDGDDTSETDSDNPPAGYINSKISSTPWMSAVFDESPTRKKGNKIWPFSGLQYDKAPVRPDPRKVDLVSRFSSASAESPRLKDGSARQRRQKIVDHPLPGIPQRRSSKRSGRSRSSSTASGASITPSLRSYVERMRSENASPEPFTGVATVVPGHKVIFRGTAKLVDIPKPKSRIAVSAVENTPLPVSSSEESSLDMYTHRLSPVRTDFIPPIRTSSAKHQPKSLESPLMGFSNQPGIANSKLRKHKRSPGNFLSRLSISGSTFKPGSPFRSSSTKAKSGAIPNENTQQSPSRDINAAISVTESEWMCRTPSPVKSSNVERYSNMWSPSPGSDGKMARRNPEHGSWDSSNGSPTDITFGGRHTGAMGSGRENNERASIAKPDSGFRYGPLQKANANETKRIHHTSPVFNAPLAKGGEKVERRISSKERLSRRAMGWYDQVRNIGDEKFDPSTPPLDESKARNGWI